MQETLDVNFCALYFKNSLVPNVASNKPPKPVKSLPENKRALSDLIE